MIRMTITADGVAKEFNRRPILRDISFSLSSPASLAITGKNGSGKSTLSKIVAGLMHPTKGSMTYNIENQTIDIEDFKHHIGFVSPYLNLYDEFTALENLQSLSRIRAASLPSPGKICELLTFVDLWHRRDDAVGTFSSGMKQRLKYAFALLHEPSLLILDEPSSNLDTDGIAIVQDIVRKQKQEGVLIIATNDEEEAAWCSQKIHVGIRKR